jgi:hypothetical protein
MMHFYRIYGLNIRSEFRLNRLPEAGEADADVTISFGNLRHCVPESGYSAGYLNTRGPGAYFSWPEVGAFLARQGTEVVYEPAPDVDERIIPFPLLGIVISAILLQRGVLVLHASAVSIGDTAVSFMGARGMGKSSIAAALYARGHTLLTDDLVALTQTDGCLTMLQPGYPQLKLMPDMAERFFGNEEVDFQFNGHGKRVCNALRSFSPEPVLVRCIYSLSVDPVLAISPLRPDEAMLELLRQSYVARVFGDFPSKTDAANHFRQCAEVARSVPVFRLQRPGSPGLPDQLAQAVEAHYVDSRLAG